MIWGVTGSVGAGKSTVATILASFGARVLDVDEVAARALAESSLGLTAAQALAAVVTGGPDRARIEAALIPVVENRIAEWAAASEVPGVLDSALLFEHGLERFCDFTVCVSCPIEERRRRVTQRNTASARLFDAIEASQWPESEKARRSTLQVSGQGDPTAALRQAWSVPLGEGRH
ncbi:MAG: dephospho-CoA kinase [Archangium sp.]|nr:dephospho-CoA kinase [Archangium sp.]